MHGCTFSIAESKDHSLQQIIYHITATTATVTTSSGSAVTTLLSPQQSNKQTSNMAPSLASNGNNDLVASIAQHANECAKSIPPQEQEIIQKENQKSLSLLLRNVQGRR